jgi:Mg2+/Co2+ transporter CorC
MSEAPPPVPVPSSAHAARIDMLLADRVRCDGALVFDLLGFYPYRGQVVKVDGAPWRVHGVDGTEVTWLELVAPRQRNVQRR